MDLACCFHQRTLSTNCGFSNNSPLYKLNLHDLVLYQRACRNVFGNLSVCRVHVRETAIRVQSCPCPRTPGRRNYPVPRMGYSFQEFLACPLGDVCKNFRVVKLRCQKNDSVPYIGDNVEDVHSKDWNKNSKSEVTIEESSIINGEEDVQEVGGHTLGVHRELLHKATKELEVTRLNTSMYEQKAEKISETAIALKDEASKAWEHVNFTLAKMKKIASEEAVAREAVEKAMMALKLAEARVKVALKFPKISSETNVSSKGSNETDPVSSSENDLVNSMKANEEECLLTAQKEIKLCKDNLVNCDVQLQHFQGKKAELQKMLDELNEAAEKVQLDALKAEEEVSSVMILAEQAMAFEVESAKKVSDAKLALQEAERSISTFLNDKPETEQVQVLSADAATDDDWNIGRKDAVDSADTAQLVDGFPDAQSVKLGTSSGKSSARNECTDKMDGKMIGDDSFTVPEIEAQKLKCVMETKRTEVQRDSSVESSLVGAPKTLLKKSSRFFPASFFSFTAHGTSASSVRDLLGFAKSHLPQVVIGLMLLGAGISICTKQPQRDIQVLQPADVFTRTEDILSTSRPHFQQLLKFPKRLKTFLEKLPTHELNEEEISHFDMLWLLLASVVFVPIFQKIPGGSPVLGYLAAGILIGPYGLSIIHHVHGTKAIAEFGVIFLLFNIGLELSVERLCSMKKYVFGLGSAQVLVTTAVIGCILHFIAGQIGPAAIVIGSGLALSSTAVVLQVLQERGESTSRHGRATFSVLLFQDLAIVVLLILIPLLSPNSSKGSVGLKAIAEALGLAAIKALAAIAGIIAGGRLLLRPIYKQIADNQNAEIFSANTLLVILGTSLLTAKAGLSMALGAFLAGLLLAETEFSLQIESDIAPYRGLLLGLFFMTVGMCIDPKLLVSNFPRVIGALGLLIIGKTTLVGLVGKIFGISLISAIRVGLLLAPGGEFAFVAFGEAVNQGIISSKLSSFLFLVVGMSMALTPWLAAGGQFIASRFELHDVRNLIPYENETDDLHDHIIICGYGRVGQIIAQLLSERLIPFIVLDVRSDRVATGRSLDLPVYFGDSGSREVLHKVGAERACAAAVTLDTPGSNYRTVWALNKYFPNVKTFVRAHDVNHGLNLEKAGATAVVPEILEPSLQLAAAVLAQAKLAKSEIASTINEFRTRHLAELRELCEANESSLGYGFARVGVK